MKQIFFLVLLASFLSPAFRNTLVGSAKPAAISVVDTVSYLLKQ